MPPATDPCARPHIHILFPQGRGARRRHAAQGPGGGALFCLARHLGARRQPRLVVRDHCGGDALAKGYTPLRIISKLLWPLVERTMRRSDMLITPHEAMLAGRWQPPQRRWKQRLSNGWLIQLNRSEGPLTVLSAAPQFSQRTQRGSLPHSSRPARNVAVWGRTRVRSHCL